MVIEGFERWVAAGGDRRGTGQLLLPHPPAGPPPTVTSEVDQDLADVGLRVLGERPPARGEPQQGHLQEVLGMAAIAHEQHSRSE